MISFKMAYERAKNTVTVRLTDSEMKLINEILKLRKHKYSYGLSSCHSKSDVIRQSLKEFAKKELNNE